MSRILLTVALLCIGLAAAPSHPPMGQASNDSVEVAAVFMDASAVMQATGSDYSKGFTVIEVTVTPKGKPVDLQPDDFLLRISSDADSTGPMAASQVLGEGGGLVLHRAKDDVIGVTRTNAANVGLTAATRSGSVSADAVDALQSKMLPAKKTAEPVTGLLFFPVAKKKAKDLDLVYTTPGGKLHISFR